MKLQLFQFFKGGIIMIKKKVISIISAMFIIANGIAGCSNIESKESAQKVVKVYQMKVEINEMCIRDRYYILKQRKRIYMILKRKY